MSLLSRVKFAKKEEDDEGEEGGLLVELEGKDEKKERETNLWFSKVRPLVLPQRNVDTNWCYVMIGHLPLHSPADELISVRTSDL